MRERAGPGGRGRRALSRSGPCENRGSECKAKFCKPSARRGGGGWRRRRPTTECSSRGHAASLALQASPLRSRHTGGRPPEGKTCAENPQMLGASSAELPVARPARPPAPSPALCRLQGHSSLPPPPPPRCGWGLLGAEPGLGAGSEDGRLREELRAAGRPGTPAGAGLGG